MSTARHTSRFASQVCTFTYSHDLAA